MLGVGIDYAIQMHARVEEEVVIDRADHPIQETARNLGPALLVVTFDAIFAFAALRFAKVPMIRQFGLLLAVGIAVICLGVDHPAARHPRHPRVQVADQGPRLPRGSARSPRRLARQLPAARRDRCSPIASVVVFVGGVVVEDKLTCRPTRSQWVNQDSQTIEDIREVEEQVGGSSELGRLRHGATTSSPTSSRPSPTTSRGTPSQEYPNELLTGSSIETAIGDVVTTYPVASDIAPTGEDVRRRVTTWRRPTSRRRR